MKMFLLAVAMCGILALQGLFGVMSERKRKKKEREKKNG